MSTRRNIRLAQLVPLLLVAAASPPVARAEGVPERMVEGLPWRLVGPFRGGWGTMASGIPEEPDTYYAGTAGGGVWKTTDSGTTWTPIFDREPASAIGALAIAPGNPQVVYVGTGHPEPRYDVAAGNGVYRSDDGGKSWQHVGLDATRTIGAIVVDPRDPKIVLVGALGHFFGPNKERGVFRSTDGGKSWKQTLFVDAQTGVTDLAADPTDPRVIFAAAWTARTWPWLSYFSPLEGLGSGLHASTDGGATWKRIAGGGFPGGKLGRIGLGLTHTKTGTRIYAVVGSNESGGLYRSDDGGATWQLVNGDKGLGSWYFARVTVAPGDPDTLYVMGRSIRKSTDGGKSFTIVKGAPGGDDYHHLWINPKHPERMITASDQGTVCTVDGGRTWSSWYNQPTGQFYHLAADDRFPYWIYSGQQDSGTVAVCSRSDYGALTFRDWHPIGADERDDDVPVPGNPDVVYGSGLGGRLSRWDARNGEVQNVTPWPVSTYGQRPTTVKYHYTWITPLAVSPRPPHALYLGAQLLFRSTDEGRHWDAISPDQSGKRPGAKNCDGDIDPKAAHDCGYGVIFSIALSPMSDDEIWIGTDDGGIRLTRDGGKSWKDVTPKGLPIWGKVSSLDLSSIETGTAYAAVDNHRQDDFGPHAFRTHDFGATWKEIGHGLPASDFVSVVRCDPVRKGLLYAGTDTSVYVSFDDGDSWQPLRKGLPTAQVRDLLVHGEDLVAATQGRAIWVLDDLSPLRQMSAQVAREAAHLFTPAAAIRVRGNQNRDTPLPPEEPTGKNPPTGASIDYWLASDATDPVKLEIRDARGQLVRRFGSDDKPEKLAASRYFADEWSKPGVSLSASAGAHRFTWDLHLPRPKAIGYEYSIAAVKGEDTQLLPIGQLAAPGKYEVVLSVDGRELRAPLVVNPDPRVVLDPAALADAIDFARSIATALEHAFVGNGQVLAVKRQLEAARKDLPADTANAALRTAIESTLAKIAPLQSGVGEEAPNIAAVGGVLQSLAIDAEATDREPTAPQREALDLYGKRLDAALARWQALQAELIPSINAALRGAGRTEVKVPGPDEIGVEVPEDSGDLP